MKVITFINEYQAIDEEGNIHQIPSVENYQKACKRALRDLRELSRMQVNSSNYKKKREHYSKHLDRIISILKDFYNKLCFQLFTEFGDRVKLNFAGYKAEFTVGPEAIQIYIQDRRDKILGRSS